MKKTFQPEDEGSETMAIETIAILNNKEALAHGKIKKENLMFTPVDFIFFLSTQNETTNQR